MRNHDLTYYPDWLVVSVEHGGYVLFLSLKNRIQTFDQDAELLEKNFGVEISRIHPRDCDDLSFTLPTCQIPLCDASLLFRGLIKQGHKIAIFEIVSETEVKSKQLDFLGNYN